MAEQKQQPFDTEAFKQTKELYDDVKSSFENLHALYDRINAAFLLKSEEMNALLKERKRVGDFKITLHPWARVSSIGAARLLAATDPDWSVGDEMNTATAMQLSNKIEKVATALWYMSGRIAGSPVHYDVALSALLYAGIDIGLVKTKELYDNLPENASKAERYHYERLVSKTPLIFQPLNVTQGYPVFDDMGLLVGYFRTIEVDSAVLLQKFSEDELKEHGVAVDKKSGKKSQSKHKLITFYDHVKKEVWIDGSKKAAPLRQEEHGYPTFPVVSQLGEGSMLFDKPEYQRQPFLYAYLESGLWQRHNLLLTRMFTNTYKLAINPQTVYTKLDDTRQSPDINKKFIGGLVEILKGESLEPMRTEAIGDDMQLLWTIANELSTETTIFKQALGEPLGANAPFSMVALLAQAGRLPLVTVQRQCNWAISTAMEYAMRWLRDDQKGKQLEVGYGTEHAAKIKVGDIPEYVVIQGSMEIDLPQDNKTNADTALQLTAGPKPLTSQRYAREKFLRIGDSKSMDKEIWVESMTAAMAQMSAENMSMKMSVMDEQGNFKPEFIQMALQQYMEMQQQGGGGMPPGGMPPEGMVPPGGEVPPMPGQGGGDLFAEDISGGTSAPGNVAAPEGAPVQPPNENEPQL